MFRNLFSYSFSAPRLKIYDQLPRQGKSGIRAVIFGPTGFLGQYIGGKLGWIGSDLIFPHHRKRVFDEELKNLKMCANTGRVQLVDQIDFADNNMLDWVMEDANVVINLVGPKRAVRDLDDMQNVNIDIPIQIAKAVKRNQNIKRFIHFSHAGQNENSPSFNFQTKAIAENIIRDIYPETTIFRPCNVYGRQDDFVRYFYKVHETFQRYFPVTDDCQSLRQPIHVEDVAQCVLNALKIDDSIGQTYELGGPYQYTQLQIYEILYNMLGKQPSLVYCNYEYLYKLASVIPNWRYFSRELMIQQRCDIIAGQSDALQVEDLLVQPVSFAQGAEKYIKYDYEIRHPGNRDELER